MTDHKANSWAFSRKGKLGGNEVLIGGHRSPVFLKLQESRSKVAMLQEKWSRSIL